MSLAIDVDRVTAVLLDDGWHPVADNSFAIDSYEFLWWSECQCKDDDDDDPMVLHGGGQSGVCAAGFSFKTLDGDVIAGPLTAIVAVRHAAWQRCTNPQCGHDQETAA
jgi:hypothetical protein